MRGTIKLSSRAKLRSLVGASSAASGWHAQTTRYLACAIALLCGLLVGVAPTLALALAAGTAAIGLLPSRAWTLLTWASLVGLILLSFGFNNIPVPLGALRMPLVDAVLLYALIASAPQWWPFLQTSLGKRILVLLALMSVIALGRLALDVPRHGAVAGRDALYVLEAWGVMVGVALGRVWGMERLHRNLSILWRVAMLWFLLYPFRDVLATVGPTVGVQRPTALIAFTNAGFAAAIALFWFSQQRRPSSLIFAGSALAVLLMAQVRGQYLAVLLTLLAGWLVHAISRRQMTKRSGSKVTHRFLAAGGLALIVLAILPPLPGRLGEQIGLGTMGAQLTTIFGADGPGAGSLRHRADAWPEVVQTVEQVPAGWLKGVGYGPDLFGGFTIAGGVEVRKPHNDPLEIWARTGLLGLVPWLMLIATFGWWALRTAPRHPRGWWLVALQMAMLMAALTQPAFGFAYLGLTYTLLVGAAMGSTIFHEPSSQRNQ